MKPDSGNTTITVLGCGYVGLTTAAILAHCGFTVYAVEPEPERLKAVKSGRSFFYEAGLDTLIRSALEMKTLIPTNDYKIGVSRSSTVFSCVGTPDNPDGSSNLEFVFSAAKEASKHMNSGAIYVQKSTVPVGTGEKIEPIFKATRKNIKYVSNPEFLREGTALYDTLYFDRVVAGGKDTDAVSKILDVYMEVERFRDHIAHITRTPTKEEEGQYIATTLNSAELIKVTSNAFLALKISFANSIAMLADRANADVVEVMDAVGADRRIGRAFLNAGRGYGGGCFPKDVSGLISSGLDHGVDIHIMEAAQELNLSLPGYIVDKLIDSMGEPIENKKIAVLGLAFKAGTSDVRKSPGIAIANKLAAAGAKVYTYDPKAHEEAAPDLHNAINQVDSIDKAVENSEAVIIATEWQEILDYPPENFASKMSGKYLLDAVNQYDALGAINAKLKYIGVGHSV